MDSDAFDTDAFDHDAFEFFDSPPPVLEDPEQNLAMTLGTDLTV